MANVLVRNLPDTVHNALKVRANRNGRSTEAEIRAILEAATLSPERIKLGSLLTAIAAEAGALSDTEMQGFARDNTPALPPSLP